MANNTLNSRFACCAKTSSEWSTNTTVILKGEFAIELTGSAPKVKIGDGVNIFKDLPYITLTPDEINALVTASQIVVDSALSDTSENPVQNKVIKAELDKKVPTSRTVNGKALSTDISLSATDVGADASGSSAQALKDAKQYTDTEVGNAKSYADQKVADLVNSAPETMDTLKELADAIEAHQDVTDALDAAIGNKVDKVAGKGLSTNDLTNDLKTKYDTAYTHSQQAHAPSDAEKNTLVGVQKNGTDVTIDPVTRKANIVVPTKVSDLTNDSKFISKVDIQGAVTGTGSGSVINATAVNAMALFLADSDVLILNGNF